MIYDYKDKESNIRQVKEYMYVKTLSMFEWFNLPDTIPQKELENLLQRYGFAYITLVNDNLYAFHGNLGGESDVYGNPTKITIANTGLNFTKTLDIKNDGVLIKSDDLMLGLEELFDKYGFFLTENEITMVMNNYNNRLQTLISASDDVTRESAEKYLDKIIQGDLGVIAENQIFEGIKVQNTGSQGNQDITKLIEYQQYLKANLYNEIGINQNFNMKRERLVSSEAEMNEDILHPYTDNMLENRLIGIELVNDKYNLDVGVQFGSIWRVKNEELKGEETDIEVEEDEEERTDDNDSERLD